MWNCGAVVNADAIFWRHCVSSMADLWAALKSCCISLCQARAIHGGEGVLFLWLDYFGLVDLMRMGDG